MRRWRVTKAYGLWYAAEYGWKRYKAFIAWAEAMAYADHMARTAKPEIVGHPTSHDALTKALSELGYKLKTSIKPSPR